MPTHAQSRASFPHRRNPDGTYDAICPQCFRTVSNQPNEISLAPLEQVHVCSTMDVVRFDGPIYRPPFAVRKNASARAAEETIMREQPQMELHKLQMVVTWIR